MKNSLKWENTKIHYNTYASHTYEVIKYGLLNSRLNIHFVNVHDK